MKKSVLTLFSLLSVNFVSAFNGFGSLSDMLYRIEPETIILLVTFIISFSFIFFALNRVLNRDGKSAAIPGIISFSISLLITYGVNRQSYEIANLFYDIGFNEGILMPFMILLFFIGIIYLWKKTSFKTLLMVLGALMIGLSFFAYERGMAFILGIILFVIGILLKGIKIKKKSSEVTPSSYPLGRPSSPPPKPGFFKRKLEQRRAYQAQLKKKKISQKLAIQQYKEAQKQERIKQKVLKKAGKEKLKQQDKEKARMAKMAIKQQKRETKKATKEAMLQQRASQKTAMKLQKKQAQHDRKLEIKRQKEEQRLKKIEQRRASP